MANKQTPSRLAGQKGNREQSGSARRDRNQIQPEEPIRQEPARRNDVVECKNCGEYYSVTYRNCPFCDERPGRSGVGGKKNSVHPIQVIGLVISMILIISALFIVFKYVGPLIFEDKQAGSTPSASVGTSQSQPAQSLPEPGDSSVAEPGDVSVVEPSVVTATTLKLDKTDITLVAGEVFQFTPIVNPGDATVTWSSSDESILQVAQDGTITNVNTTGSKVKVTVTASSGDLTAQCTVYCGSKSGGTSSSGQQSGGESQTQQPSGGSTDKATLSAGTRAVISVSGSGLNIRSGPGSSYEKIASAANGAEVTILGAENGWYKIDYGNGKVGYVSADYVKAK